MDAKGFTFKKVAWLLVGLVFLVFVVFHYEIIFDKLHFLVRLLDPFFFGLFFAFLLNFPMRFAEKRLFKKYSQIVARPLSFLFAIIVFLAIFSLILITIIPQLGSSILMIINSLPEKITKLQISLKPYSSEYPELQMGLQSIKLQIPRVSSQLTNYVKDNMTSLLLTTKTFLLTLLHGISSFFVSLVFASLIILNKEKLSGNIQRFMAAYFPPKLHHKITVITRMANRIFTAFVTGTCLESIFVGIIFFIVLTIAQFQYALLIATLVGLLSLVPMVGKSLAWLFGFLLTLISQGFSRALMFMVVFLIVDKLSRFFLHPRLVSRSLGVPGAWSFLAATIGASLFGVWGILLCVPISSLLYSLLKMNIKSRLTDREISLEFPQ